MIGRCTAVLFLLFGIRKTGLIGLDDTFEDDNGVHLIDGSPSMSPLMTSETAEIFMDAVAMHLSWWKKLHPWNGRPTLCCNDMKGIGESLWKELGGNVGLTLNGTMREAIHLGSQMDGNLSMGTEC